MPQPNQNLQQSLANLNFTNKEAKIYLALLELGKGTVTQITRKAGLNRTTGYDILDSLTNRALVSISGKEPKQEYIAEPPDKILTGLTEQIAQNKKQLEQARAILPQLRSIHNVGDRPKVKFYEGKEGLIQVYEDTLSSKETIKAFATVDDMHRTLPDYFPKYYKRRAQKGIAIDAIIPDTKMARERVAHNKEEKRTVALIPADKFYFSPEINIYDNKVMIASWREKLGIIIESAEIADALKKIYELAWAEAKRYNK
ncbi:MAG: helix-turn-helix domain-containing protein [Patescibacteria group bacterium]